MAVMSTLMGSIIKVQAVHPEIPPPVLASALAIICGAIILFLGFLRLGFIVDFIPLPAISAFMTGSAINVCAGQVKTVLGEKVHFSTWGATYKIIIDTLLWASQLWQCYMAYGLLATMERGRSLTRLTCFSFCPHCELPSSFFSIP